MKRLLLVAVVLAAGCTSVEYSDKEVTFKRTSFATRLTMKRLEKTKDGLILEGYMNDQIEGAAIITKAAVEGAIAGLAKGAKP